MRHLLTAFVAGLLVTVATSAQAEDIVTSDQSLAQLGVEGMTLVSDAEGEAIRGKNSKKGGSGKNPSSSPFVQFDLQNLVLVDLKLARSTTVFVQNDLAIDLNVLTLNSLNLQIGSIGGGF